MSFVGKKLKFKIKLPFTLVSIFVSFHKGIIDLSCFVRLHCVSFNKAVDAGNSKVAPMFSILILTDVDKFYV